LNIGFVSSVIPAGQRKSCTFRPIYCEIRFQTFPARVNLTYVTGPGNRHAPDVSAGDRALAAAQASRGGGEDSVTGGQRGELAIFRPHLLVHNDNDGLRPEDLASVLFRITVLYSNGMDAHMVADGEVSEAIDISTEDLFRVVDAAIAMAER
jgi:hypothetical protein